MSDILAPDRPPPAPSRSAGSLVGHRPAIETRVDSRLAEFLGAKARSGTEGDPVPNQLTLVLREFFDAGGKRIRPLLCMLGWQAAGGAGLPGSVVGVAAALEMFHAVALIHDDLMDGSASRRGRPSVHRTLAERLGPGLTPERAEQLGANTAVLAGDLALTWSDELLLAALTPNQLATVLPLVSAMRAEAVHGQYLDLTAAGRHSEDLPLALAIGRYKTATYTVQRPLQIGATLAGAAPELLAGLSAFALPIGEAFQLRDDLLGAFGDPARTGKPELDDLRDGKHTVLAALAFERATPGQRVVLENLLGSPALDRDGARQLRRVLAATGARAEVERLIAERRAQALAALAALALPGPVDEALTGLAHRVTTRQQ
ncbi:polyprenyl synthetase family protein [Kitasatospora sp. NPDC089509]|uniref:polyprenyl synthetase family protein n=1 Tax=Kitasatospora sp. NPDC089509 TaxID=3364079 RepID=UPI0038059F22